MSQQRRTIGLSKVEIALIFEGLAHVRRKAGDSGDLFKQEVVDSLVEHIQVVRRKMDELK